MGEAYPAPGARNLRVLERRDRLRTIGIGRDRFVVGPWQGDPRVAYLSTHRSSGRVDPGSLRSCLQNLRSAGFESVMTPALHPEETPAFFVNGFREFDSLAVLGHSLTNITPPPRELPGGLVIRRARRRDLGRVFTLDARSFPQNWRIDLNGLKEAKSATTRVRFRVVEQRTGTDQSDGSVLGYAIAGRTGSMGFLQRLATDPDWSGRGIGSTMVTDALMWAKSGRCSTLLVNTQLSNRRALALYESLGFVRTATRLTVLRCSL